MTAMPRGCAELRDTYHGVLMILRHFISKDNYTQNHSYRVSIYAARIAAEMGFDEERVEDVRAAALLHDIGKLDISREMLYKAARLTSTEFEEMREHVARGVNMLEPVGGSLRRVLPIILTHHDSFDGSGYSDRSGDEIPLEARILAVADAYDAITSDRPYRKGSTPFEAREILESKAGHEFDPGSHRRLWARLPQAADGYSRPGGVRERDSRASLGLRGPQLIEQ